MAGTSLRDRIVEILSRKRKSPLDLPAIIPDTLAHDVLRWSPVAAGPHHSLFHVREDNLVGLNVKKASNDDAVPHAAALTAWLASVTDAELATVTPERPFAFVDRKALHPFGGFAVVHPAQEAFRAVTDDEVTSLSYLVFPAHRSEVPLPEGQSKSDARWTKVQLAYMRWSDVARERMSAVRLGRTPHGQKKPAARSPMQPHLMKTVLASWRPAREDLELERWDHRTLRLIGSEMSVVDAEAALATFFD